MPKKRSYSEKLNDPRWQKMRLLVLERAGWKCEGCEATDLTLYVHHEYYERNKEPWEYHPLTLWAFCNACHERAEDLRRAFYEEAAHIHPLRLDGMLLGEILEPEDDLIFLRRGDSRAGMAAENSRSELAFLAEQENAKG